MGGDQTPYRLGMLLPVQASVLHSVPWNSGDHGMLMSISKKMFEFNVKSSGFSPSQHTLHQERMPS